MEIEVHKGPAPTVPSNGTNGHGNGNGHDGIAVPVVEALAPVTASEPVVAAETAEVIGEQGASADSESTGAPRNEGEGKKTPRLHNKQARQMKDDDPVVFRPWEVGPVVSKLVAVDLITALAQRPEGGRWSDRVRDAYGPARHLLDSVGEKQVKERLQNIVRSGEDGHQFACRQAKDIVNKLLTRLIYAIMPGVDEGLRVWFKDRVIRLDEELGWFCHADQYELELEEGRRRQKELEEGRRRQAERQKVAEIARGTDEMLGALSLLGPDLVIKTSASVKGGDQSEITAGSTVRGNVLGFAIGNGRNGNKYVAGIRFRIGSGREVFVPLSVTGWQMTRDENAAGFMARLRSHFSDGREFQLKVTEIGPDRKGGIRIVARLMSEMDVARPDNSKPVTLGIKLNDEVAGKVRWVGNEGVVVRLFAPDIELFVSAGDLAPDTALGDYRRGDRVEGVVIQGDRKPYAMKITVREECRGKGEQPAPEHIIHPERVEMVREYATAQGLGLGERWNTLREYAERANRLGTLKPEEIELARVFFGEILKDVADVPAEISEAAVGVVTTRGAYREEQEAKQRKLDGQGVAEDKRPFCKNHEAGNGQRCDKRVEKAGDLCDRCTGKERRMSAKAPKPPSKPKDKKGADKQCKACRKSNCRKH